MTIAEDAQGPCICYALAKYKSSGTSYNSIFRRSLRSSPVSIGHVHTRSASCRWLGESSQSLPVSFSVLLGGGGCRRSKLVLSGRMVTVRTRGQVLQGMLFPLVPVLLTCTGRHQGRCKGLHQLLRRVHRTWRQSRHHLQPPGAVLRLM